MVDFLAPSGAGTLDADVTVHPGCPTPASAQTAAADAVAS
jgi:hypothetical protein